MRNFTRWLCLLLCMGVVGMAQAQDKVKKTIKITVTTTDENGNTITETKVYNNDDAVDLDDFDPATIDQVEVFIDKREIMEDARLQLEGARSQMEEALVLIEEMEENGTIARSLEDAYDRIGELDIVIAQDLSGTDLDGINRHFNTGKDHKGVLGVYLSDEVVGKGAKIKRVVKGSGAEKLGLKAGDIINSINGRTVRDNDDLQDALRETVPGDKVEVTYTRDGQSPQTGMATLGRGSSKSSTKTSTMRLYNSNGTSSYYDNNNGGEKEWCEKTVDVPLKPYIGIYLDNNCGDLSGAHVTSVIDGTMAERVTLQKDDIIVAINGQDIQNIRDLRRIKFATEPGANTSITVVRNGATVTVSGPMGSTGGGTKTKRVRCDRFDDDEPCANICEKTRTIPEKPFIGVYIYNGHGEGATISSVIDGTSATRLDKELQQGDVITAFNGTPVRNISQLHKIKMATEPKTPYTMTIKRGDNTMQVSGILGYKESYTKKYKTCCDQEIEDGIEEELELLEEEEQGDIQQSEIPDFVNVSPFRADGEGQAGFDAPKLELQQFEMFPNPTDGNFTLNFTSGNMAPVSVRVTDVTGKVIYTEEVTNFGGNYNNRINIGDSNDGIYFVTILQDRSTFTDRLVIARR